MTDEDIKRIKKLIIEKLDVTESEINDEASFEKDFGVYSLDVYELIMEVEQEFNMEIPDEEIEKITTVGSLKEYINKRAGIENLRHNL